MTAEQIKALIEQLDGLALAADEIADRLHQAKHRADDVEECEGLALAAERAGQAWVHAKGSARALREIRR